MWRQGVFSLTVNSPGLLTAAAWTDCPFFVRRQGSSSNLGSSASVTLTPLRDSTRVSRQSSVARSPRWRRLRSVRRFPSPHPLRTNGDGSSRAHPSSMQSGQCELHRRRNLHCMLLRRRHALQTSRIVHSQRWAQRLLTRPAGLDSPAPDLAHDGLRRPADPLRDGVGRPARVQPGLHGEAFHRGQPRLPHARRSFRRCLVRVHVFFPFCARPSDATGRIRISQGNCPQSPPGERMCYSHRHVIRFSPVRVDAILHPASHCPTHCPYTMVIYFGKSP